MASSTTPIEAPKVEDSAPVEGSVQNSCVENAAAENSAAPPENSTSGAVAAEGPVEPGTPKGSEAGAAVPDVNNGGDAAGGSSPVEGLVANGGAAADENEAEGEETAKPSGKTLEEADALFRKGCDAVKANDLFDAVDSLSRALEIRVAHFGELAPECAMTYFKYGCALLYKAQDEADPLNESVALAKKAQACSKNVTEGSSEKAGKDDYSEIPSKKEKSDADESFKLPTNTASAPPASDAKGKSSVNDDNANESTNEAPNGEEEDDEGEESDDEDAGENVAEDVEEEEDSDLDLAWKMLEFARIIHDRQQDTVEKVEVISALGDVSLEREDFSTSEADYSRALSILEGLEQAESRHIAELCFKLCLALQMQNKIPDALNYCQRALSICTKCTEKLTNEVENSKVGLTSKDAQTSNGCNGNGKNNILDTGAKEDEIKVLKGLMADLSDKVEDLKQMMSEPPLSEVARSLDDKNAESKFQFAFTGRTSQQEGTVSTGFDEPKLTNVPSSGTVTHLGVVGRGVKRAAPLPVDSSEPVPKRLSIESTPVEKADASTIEVSKSVNREPEGEADKSA